jgi:hypothetical protein
MGPTGSSGAKSVLRRAFSQMLSALRPHRHRVEPDLSALIAFPSCGALLWPDGGGVPSATPRVESEH